VSPVSDIIHFLTYTHVLWAFHLHNERIRKSIFIPWKTMHEHSIDFIFLCTGTEKAFPFRAYRALTLLPYSVVLTGQFSCFCNPITVPFPTVIPSVLKVVAVYSSKMLVLLISHWYQLKRLNPWHHSHNSHHCENHKCQQNNFLLLPTIKVQL
jgi:hypothetical protein